MELKKTIYGVLVALLLGIVVVFPANEIIYVVEYLFSIRISYTFIDITYVVLLVLICKYIFKKMDQKKELEAQDK